MITITKKGILKPVDNKPMIGKRSRLTIETDKQLGTTSFPQQEIMPREYNATSGPRLSSRSNTQNSF